MLGAPKQNQANLCAIISVELRLQSTTRSLYQHPSRD